MSQDSQSLRRNIPSLQSLILFEAAARYLNFSKAAAELSISQPAVSQAVRQLETVLGKPLFVRDKRALSLTTQGQRLYASVANGFAGISETLDEIAGQPKRDKLVICTSTVMAIEWLMPRLPDFRQANPDILIDLRSLDRDPDLTAENIDVHLRLGDGHWPGCDAIELWRERIFPICSPAYLQSAGKPVSPDDLLSHRLIHYADPYRVRMGWGEWLRAKGVACPAVLPSNLNVNDSLFAQKAAENGDGISLGWNPIVDRALTEKRLSVALDEAVETGRSFYVVTANPPNRRKVALLFRDWVVKTARDTTQPLT